MALRLLAPVVLTACLLAACGQKGPLYQPDEGLPVPEGSAPAELPAPTPAAAGDAAVSTPVTPASPDRSDEARKRIPDTPTPAEAQ